MRETHQLREQTTAAVKLNRIETAEYIYTLSGELFALSAAHELHTLQYLFSMVRLEAAMIREDQDHSVKR